MDSIIIRFQTPDSVHRWMCRAAEPTPIRYKAEMHWSAEDSSTDHLHCHRLWLRQHPSTIHRRNPSVLFANRTLKRSETFYPSVLLFSLIVNRRDSLMIKDLQVLVDNALLHLRMSFGKWTSLHMSPETTFLEDQSLSQLHFDYASNEFKLIHDKLFDENPKKKQRTISLWSNESWFKQWIICLLWSTANVFLLPVVFFVYPSNLHFWVTNRYRNAKHLKLLFFNLVVNAFTDSMTECFSLRPAMRGCLPRREKGEFVVDTDYSFESSSVSRANDQTAVYLTGVIHFWLVNEIDSRLDWRRTAWQWKEGRKKSEKKTFTSRFGRISWGMRGF